MRETEVRDDEMRDLLNQAREELRPTEADKVRMRHRLVAVIGLAPLAGPSSLGVLWRTLPGKLAAMSIPIVVPAIWLVGAAVFSENHPAGVVVASPSAAAPSEPSVPRTLSQAVGGESTGLGSALTAPPLARELDEPREDSLIAPELNGRAREPGSVEPTLRDDWLIEPGLPELGELERLDSTPGDGPHQRPSISVPAGRVGPNVRGAVSTRPARRGPRPRGAGGESIVVAPQSEDAIPVSEPETHATALRLESGILRRAIEALGEGSVDEAQALLRLHERTYPNGVLRAERESLWRTLGR